MSTGELIAWQAGVDWSRTGSTSSAMLAGSRRTLATLLGPDVIDARDQLGGDIFGYWFRQGMTDHQGATAR